MLLAMLDMVRFDAGDGVEQFGIVVACHLARDAVTLLLFGEVWVSREDGGGMERGRKHRRNIRKKRKKRI